MRLWKAALLLLVALVLGSLGVFALVNGVFTPFCASSEPIAPGMCPLGVSPIEAKSLFVGLVSMIVLSSVPLLRSLVGSRLGRVGALQKVGGRARRVWPLVGVVAGVLVSAVGVLDGCDTSCALYAYCSCSGSPEVLPLLVTGAVLLALAVGVFALSFMKTGNIKGAAPRGIVGVEVRVLVGWSS